MTSLDCYQQRHSRIRSGFLFLKMYGATWESQTFALILFNACIYFLISLRQQVRVSRCYNEGYFLHFNFKKLSRNSTYK